MTQVDQITQELRNLDVEIKEWQEALEELYDARNKLEREVRRNEREVAEKKEELMELRALKEFLMKKRVQIQRGAGIHQQASAAAGSAHTDGLSRNASPKRRQVSPRFTC